MGTHFRERGLPGRAAAAALGLGAWFFLAYGFCNWWSSRLPHVGTFLWDWERHIPFIPEFIVPYMSIDLFFVGGFFLCGSRHELRIMTRRIFADITASAALFLLFPLQLGVVRPTPVGWTAPVFAFLHAGDLPYNLAPSLHISLRSLLWITYGRHLRGTWRQAAKIWFMLIGVSTLLTWQHHVFDVATGFLMAWIIMAAIPDPEAQPGVKMLAEKRSRQHLVLARRYGGGTLACVALAFVPKAGCLFLWPAAALGITSLAYATAQPRFYQKSSGTLSPAVEWLLLPVQMIRLVWQRRWMRRETAWVQADRSVRFGRRPTSREAVQLINDGCVASVDLTAESNASLLLREHTAYLNAPVLDLTLPTAGQLREILAFIERHCSRGLVMIHCELGLGRSAIVAAAWLLHCGRASHPAEAMRHISTLRPQAVFGQEAAALLSQIKTPQPSPVEAFND
jgi:protein-tyrosine phosphatase